MRLEESVMGDGILLVLHGDIVSGQCDTLADRIRALMDRKRRQVMLDLSRVRYIDSRGVGALVEALTVARNRAGSLRLVGVNWRVNEVLVVAGLSAILTESQPCEGGHDEPMRPTTMH